MAFSETVRKLLLLLHLELNNFCNQPNSKQPPQLNYNNTKMTKSVNLTDTEVKFDVATAESHLQNTLWVYSKSSYMKAASEMNPVKECWDLHDYFKMLTFNDIFLWNIFLIEGHITDCRSSTVAAHQTVYFIRQWTLTGWCFCHVGELLLIGAIMNLIARWQQISRLATSFCSAVKSLFSHI